MFALPGILLLLIGVGMVAALATGGCRAPAPFLLSP